MEETKLVVRVVPFQVTSVPTAVVLKFPKVKPDPLTVMVKVGLPATAALGDRLVSVMVCGAVMENVRAFDTRVPLCAVTVAVPCCEIRFGGTVALNCVAETTVVLSAAPFQ